jgi:hypothetical protein
LRHKQPTIFKRGFDVKQLVLDGEEKTIVIFRDLGVFYNLPAASTILNKLETNFRIHHVLSTNLSDPLFENTSRGIFSILQAIPCLSQFSNSSTCQGWFPSCCQHKGIPLLLLLLLLLQAKLSSCSDAD